MDLTAAKLGAKMALKAIKEAGGTGGGGNDPTIVNVVELPASYIREDAFYVKPVGCVTYNQIRSNESKCYCVSGLPASGEPVTLDMVNITAYYNVLDGVAYGYINATLSGALSVPVGWYELGMLLAATGNQFGGVIYDIKDAPESGSIACVLIEHDVYIYKNTWILLNPDVVGVPGTSKGAEVFNYSGNVANSAYSHAEGLETTAGHVYTHAEGQNTTANNVAAHAEGFGTLASGMYSHAEGNKATASGGFSHAEGSSTTASGTASHAEGSNAIASGSDSHAEGQGGKAEGHASHAEGIETKAIGDGSHAEGFYTEARANYSHAEGANTIAASFYQHVQGQYNIVDDANKYAHIVGNGEYNAPSNAHTLDWEGNAWYAGTVEGTALIIKSLNGARFKITVDNNGSLLATAI